METVWEVNPARHNKRNEERGQLLIVDKNESAQSESCFTRCLRCMSHVPCASLIAWIMLLLGLGGVTGSLLVAADRTRDLLEDERILWFVEYMIIGIAVGMFVVSTCLLIVGHFSSEPNNRHVFNTMGKNACAWCLNIFMLILSYVLILAWIFASALLIVPVTALGLLIYLQHFKHITCINLEHYGYSFKDICNDDLVRFINHCRDLLLCYGATYISSIIIIISLVHFLMCISANITHLRDAKFETLNTYDVNRAQNAKQINDTSI